MKIKEETTANRRKIGNGKAARKCYLSGYQFKKKDLFIKKIMLSDKIFEKT